MDREVGYHFIVESLMVIKCDYDKRFYPNVGHKYS
jgi:hypothetical protein